MFSKGEEKKKAITLRKQGKTYAEILKEVPVAKSTLSLWLREVGLSKGQIQRITTRRRAAQLRGAQSRKTDRIERTNKIHSEAMQAVGQLTKREQWLIGAALYWAEGTKERSGRIGQGIDFANTDPAMVKFFSNWLRDILGVESDQITLSLYLHKNHKERLPSICKYWEGVVNIPSIKISYVYLKKHNPKTVRKKVNESEYYGTLRIGVRRSTDLQRKIQGTIYGITGEYCPVV